MPTGKKDKRECYSPICVVYQKENSVMLSVVVKVGIPVMRKSQSSQP